MKKFFALALALVLALSLTVASADELKVIRVGATAAPHAEILESEAVTAKLAELGYKLEVVVYDGYVLENPAVADGTDDANYFQHQPYLDSYNATASESEQVVAAFTVHYEPFAIYSKSLTDIADLKDGAHIGLPNDPSNETRALLLLQAAGLITVPEGTTAASSLTKYDITAEMNPHGYVFDEVAAELLPSTLEDYDIAVINGNYAIQAGLKVADALATEAADGDAAQTYANIIAVRNGDESSEKTLALVKALQTDAVKQFIADSYNGAVVAIF